MHCRFNQGNYNYGRNNSFYSSNQGNYSYNNGNNFNDTSYNGSFRDSHFGYNRQEFQALQRDIMKHEYTGVENQAGRQGATQGAAIGGAAGLFLGNMMGGDGMNAALFAGLGALGGGILGQQHGVESFRDQNYAAYRIMGPGNPHL